MPVTRVIQYTTKPEHAAENEKLIREVFAELAADQPEGLHYASFRLDDGVTFVHVATLDSDANPLAASAAFAKFQSGIKDRCADGPHASGAAIVGSYRSLPG
jgi:acyl dehydratase